MAAGSAWRSVSTAWRCSATLPSSFFRTSRDRVPSAVASRSLSTMKSSMASAGRGWAAHAAAPLLSRVTQR